MALGVYVSPTLVVCIYNWEGPERGVIETIDGSIFIHIETVLSQKLHYERE